MVEAAANMAIERAKKAQSGKDNLTWGTFVRNSVTATATEPASAKATKAPKAVKEKK